MDALWEIYGRSRRERSLTPIPSYSPPPQSPEPRGPRRLHEIQTAEEEDRAIMILSHLRPIMSPANLEDSRCIICLDPLPEPTNDGDALAVELRCGHAYCRDCIMPWLLEVPNDCCPYCRRRLSEEPLTVTPRDGSDSEASSSAVGEEEDGDTVMGDDDGEEGEDHDEEEVADAGDEMDEDDHDNASAGSSDGDEGEDDVQLGTMYVGGLRRSARNRGN